MALKPLLTFTFKLLFSLSTQCYFVRVRAHIWSSNWVGSHNTLTSSLIVACCFERNDITGFLWCVSSIPVGLHLAVLKCSAILAFLEQHWASWINLACSDACNRRNKSDFHVDVLFICHKPVIEKREGCPTTFLLWSNKTHIWIRMYWIALCKEQYL